MGSFLYVLIEWFLFRLFYTDKIYGNDEIQKHENYRHCLFYIYQDCAVPDTLSIGQF